MVTQRVKPLSAMRETWVWSLGLEDPLEKEMATHSGTLGWKILWMKKPGRLQSMGRKELDTAEQIHFHFHYHGMPKQYEYIWIPFLFQTSIQKPQASLSEKFSSVQFIHPVVSDSLQPHESQHTRPPCPSPTPRVYANSCPLSRLFHPTISSSVVPFSSCSQSLPASGSFPMSQLFAWGGQSIGVSASASVLPMNTQDWSPSGWTGWLSLQSKGTLKSLLQHHSSKASILQRSAFFTVQLLHPYMTTGKTEYQPLIPQFLTVQLNYYFLITSITFDHLSIQTTKTNILLTLQASYSIYNIL